MYRLAAAAAGGARLIVSNVAGDTVAKSEWPGRAGRASREVEFPAGGARACSGRADAVAASRQHSASRARAAVLDSLTKAGYDTAAIRTVRTQVACSSIRSRERRRRWTRRSWWWRRWWSWRWRRPGMRAPDDAVGDVLRASRRNGRTGGGGGGGARAFGGLDSATTAVVDSARLLPASAAAGGGRGGRGGRGAKLRPAMQGSIRSAASGCSSE